MRDEGKSGNLWSFILCHCSTSTSKNAFCFLAGEIYFPTFEPIRKNPGHAYRRGAFFRCSPGRQLPAGNFSGPQLPSLAGTVCVIPEVDCLGVVRCCKYPARGTARQLRLILLLDAEGARPRCCASRSGWHIRASTLLFLQSGDLVFQPRAVLLTDDRGRHKDEQVALVTRVEMLLEQVTQDRDVPQDRYLRQTLAGFILQTSRRWPSVQPLLMSTFAFQRTRVDDRAADRSAPRS